MNQSVSELTNKILADSRIKTKSKDICDKTEEFVNKYWDILRQINKSTNLNELKERMLTDIKSMLSNYKYIDIYAGYQIVAEIWKNALTHDSELIASVGFYAAGRTREKNMVTKGKNKERVQDGWIGAIIPNDLIARNLYSEDLRAIEDKKSRVAEIDNELSELVEAAKVEDSDENDALYDALKKNDDGEPQDSFENKKVKLELKLAAKGTLKYDLLKKVESLNAEKALKNKAIKNEETTLKEAIYDRITKLKNSEIDELVYEKWFGNIISDMANLVEVPLKKELETLDMLKSRYSDTLNSIDDEINNLEKEFESLMNELVVM